MTMTRRVPSFSTPTLALASASVGVPKLGTRLSRCRRIALTSVAMIGMGQCSCGRAGPPAATQPASKLFWDFSGDCGLARLQMPWTSLEDVQYVTGPKDIVITARGGLTGEERAWMAQAWKKGDNIRSLVIFFPPETVEEAYATAKRVADKWEFPKHDKIDAFRKTHGENARLDGPLIQAVDDAEQPRAIEIRRSLSGNSKEWAVQLVLGFPERHLVSNGKAVK